MPEKNCKLIMVGGGRLAGLLYSMFKDEYEIVGYVDDVYPHAYVEEKYGLKSLGTSKDLSTWLNICRQAVVAITNTAARKKYREKLLDAGFALATLIAKTAIVADNAEIAPGCIIRHSAIIGPMVRLGENTVVSDHAYVGHDSNIGRNVYIAPGVNINGSVSIGEGTFVGTGAVILPELRIGNDCVIGAAACVNKDIEGGDKVAGVPARLLKPVMNGPTVTVLIASYNHEKYVAESLRSVLGQTYQDFEIVIVDDGSTDGTVAEIKKISDPRIKQVFLSQNQGIIAAKTKGLSMASGRYIAILNSDDMFLPDKLGKQVAFLDSHPEVGAVLTQAHIIDDDGKPFLDQNHFYYDIFTQPNRTRQEWLHDFFYKGNCLCMPSVLIRRECYEAVGYPDKRLQQLPDFDLWIRMCFRYELHILQEKLTLFRVRANEANTSGDRPENRIRNSYEYTKVLRHYLTIEREDELLKIFPEAEKHLDPYFPLESPVIPFVIAKLALDTDSGIHHVFAMDTLFELLGDPGLARKLYDRFRFTYKDFIKISGEYDLFRLNEVTRLHQEITPLQGEVARLHQELTPLQGKVARLHQELARLQLRYLISRLLRKILRRA
jgi:sugar O-acyltransferase (sialic acid O-acetyltransferase NeuD family)